MLFLLIPLVSMDVRSGNVHIAIRFYCGMVGDLRDAIFDDLDVVNDPEKGNSSTRKRFQNFLTWFIAVQIFTCE